MIETIVIAIIGSGALSTVISAIITAINNRNGIKSKLKKLEKDSIRTQLLLMISDYPDEKQEIMTLAQYYFETLKADWYLSSLFDKWLQRHKMERPNWFNGGSKNENS